MWDSLFDALSVLLWKPTERRPLLALRLWVAVVVVTFAALVIFLVAR
jgi:hypothetical protein